MLDAMSEETLTGKILGMREPYRTPLPPDAAGAAYRRGSGPPLRQAPENRGGQVYRAKKMLAAQLRASGAEAPQKPERRNQNG